MNAELRETLELVRVIDQRIITFSEHHSATVPVRNAAERVRAGLIDVLRTALKDLSGTWPAVNAEQLAVFEQWLDAGKIPEQDGMLPKLIDQGLTAIEDKIARRKKSLATAAA